VDHATNNAHQDKHAKMVLVNNWTGKGLPESFKKENQGARKTPCISEQLLLALCYGLVLALSLIVTTHG
jgi:hypothetical protein